MRVMHIITGLNDGGAEGVLYRLVAHDAVDQHHVVSLTGDGKYGQLLRQSGAAVTVLGMPRGRLTLHGMRGLWRAVRIWGADVIQTWMYHADLLGGLAGWQAGVPVVWGIRHTTLEPGRSARATIWVARLCAWLSRRVPTRIVACAQAAVQVHAAIGYDSGRLVVIPNGYNLSHFGPAAPARFRLRAEWAMADDMPVIGMVARFDPQKDHANLLAALVHLQGLGVEFQAVLVGSGIEAHNHALTAQIAASGLSNRVHLLGPRSDIPAIMGALDIHALSSAGEAFPNVIAEAMACGTPCVTTDVGDAARIVGDTGWVVPARDAGSLATALAAALSDCRDRPAWGLRQERCRQRIRNEFGIDQMVQRYRQVWETAVGGWVRSQERM